MKILYILHANIMGGATLSFLNLLRGVVEKGHQAVVVTPVERDSVALAAELNRLGIGHYNIPMTCQWKLPLGLLTGIRQYLKTAALALLRKSRCNDIYEESIQKLSEIIDIEHPDIIHTNTGVVHIGQIVALQKRIKHVWHLREYQEIDFNAKILPSKAVFLERLQQSDAVITITKDIYSYFNLQAHPCSRVVYNGVFNKSDACFEFPKEKYYLCFSRISPEKGQRDVMLAFDKFYVTHPDYRLLIAGFGSENYINELKKLQQKLKSGGAIAFIGFQKDAKKYMRKARALVVASPNEGFGRMSAEALFCGCLLIGRNSAGTKEILDYTGGYPYDGSVEDLACKMESVAKLSDSEYQGKAMSAQAKAVSTYSNESYVSSVIDVYKEILG